MEEWEEWSDDVSPNLCDNARSLAETYKHTHTRTHTHCRICVINAPFEQIITLASVLRSTY